MAAPAAVQYEDYEDYETDVEAEMAARDIEAEHRSRTAIASNPASASNPQRLTVAQPWPARVAPGPAAMRASGASVLATDVPHCAATAVPVDRLHLAALQLLL